ncbi:MAG: SDR family oxidoreductase [Anaerolinea sp.]|nr:SDR family oxidoreductase [Anaerolinea sp.]
MAHAIHDQVVVITGASSGMGREMALKFAAKGASVVLAARNEGALEMVALEIRQNGGTAHVVPTDVSSWEQVDSLAQEAMTVFGQINTWINDAGVSIYATVEETDPEEFEQLIHINLLGVIYGSKAALSRMRAQGFGTIINFGSVLSDRAVPLQSAYIASKFGVKGFTQALRLEVMRERLPINVTLVLPAGVNTPFFSHARSKMGVKPQPLPPVYKPEAVADAVLYAAEHPRRDVHVGGASWMFSFGQRLSPALMDRFALIGDWTARLQKTNEPDDRRDNLFSPVNEPGQVHGEFEHLTKPSLYARLVEMQPTWTRVVVPTLFAAAVFFLRRR